jgi:hypothetical protein
MMASKNNTYIRCQGRKLFAFCPACDWQVFHTSPASAPRGLGSLPKMRASSASLVVAPSTKWVYHCQTQLKGSPGARACIAATAAA